jgi:RNA polymerase sigma factor (sigma-70 family)
MGRRRRYGLEALLNSEEEQSSDEGVADLDVEPDLRARLATFWASGALSTFYGAVTAELCPQLHRALRAQFRLDDDQCEDCTAQALERLVNRQANSRPEIADPQGYIYQSAYNSAVDLRRSQKRDREIAQGWAEVHNVAPRPVRDEDPVETSREDPSNRSSGAQLLVPTSWAAILIEESLGEVEVEASSAQEIALVSIARLPPTQRRVIEYLMLEDFDYASNNLAYDARQAALSLGMTEGAIRTNKSRAFERLRAEIPKVLRELGIVLPSRLMEAITAPRPSLPTEEEEGP